MDTVNHCRNFQNHSCTKIETNKRLARRLNRRQLMGGAGGDHLSNPPPPAIPIEIVTEEEMVLIELALSSAAAAAASLPRPPKLLSLLPTSARGPAISGFRPRRSLSVCSSSGASSDDIEDSGGAGPKEGGRPSSLLERFRNRRGLAVTDITASVRFFLFAISWMIDFLFFMQNFLSNA